MVEAHWLLFIAASVVIMATPGLDMLYAMSKLLARGARAGVASAAGLSTGLVGHTVLATLSPGALPRTSEWIFTALKLAGAPFLLFLAIWLPRSPAGRIDAAPSVPRESDQRLFLTGALSNIGNAKIAVVHFAFLPQSVVPGARHPTVTALLLGVAFAAMTFMIKGPVGVFAGQVSSWLRARPAALGRLTRCSGLVRVGLAARLALARRGDA